MTDSIRAGARPLDPEDALWRMIFYKAHAAVPYTVLDSDERLRLFNAALPRVEEEVMRDHGSLLLNRDENLS